MQRQSCLQLYSQGSNCLMVSGGVCQRIDQSYSRAGFGAGVSIFVREEEVGTYNGCP